MPEKLPQGHPRVTFLARGQIVKLPQGHPRVTFLVRGQIVLKAALQAKSAPFLGLRPHDPRVVVRAAA